jgi:hypothetical protein
MNRNQAKELLPIIKAFSEGKKIIVKDKRLSDEEYNWSEVDDCSFNIEQFEYRIKPEPKYRPFKDAEECWAEMLKHHPFGWVKMKGTESKYYMLKCIGSRVVIGLDETPFSYKKVFEDYVFADGTPFGVKVEE